MRYRVSGTVQQTDSEISTSIDAGTPEEAEREAQRRGIFVTEIHPESQLEELDWSDEELATEPQSEVPATAPTGRTGPRNTYPDIASSATSLKVVSSIIFAFCVLYFLAAFVGIVLIPLTITRGDTNLPLTQAITLIVGGLAGGVVCLALSSLLRMAGAAGMALRDIAMHVNRP